MVFPVSYTHLDVYKRQISNLGDDPRMAKRIRLVEQRGFLVLEITQTDEPDQTVRAVLKPVSDTQALLLGPLADSGETVRSVIINGVEHLAYSGYVARKIDGSRP